MEITCINCPVGCRMQVTLENGQVTAVTGNTCKRGYEYALQESVAPCRMVTAVVEVEDSPLPVSVKTRTSIPKERIFDCMTELSRLKLHAPIHLGDVICPNVCGTGVDVIATRDVLTSQAR